METRAFIRITGMVQGVYFRYSTKQKADELALTGTVKNMVDGSVEVVCEGEEKDVRALIEWCGRGPRGARVDEVRVTWGDYKDAFRGFSTVY